ncbi:MAG: hypothetical protein Q7R64_01080 [bacterium]|nr:hypothetical protein [bacterium]
MSFPYLETKPAWWKLCWNPDIPALQVYVAKAFIEAFRPIPKNSPFMQILKDEGVLRQYGSPSCDFNATNFGFGESIVRKEATEAFALFEVPLPRIWQLTGKSCAKCEGEGVKDGRACLYCGGSGAIRACDWSAGYVVTRSLGLLFSLLEIPPQSQMPTGTPQWLLLRLWSSREINGSALGGVLGSEGLRLFDQLLVQGGELPLEAVKARITDAIAYAWRYMMGENRNDNGTLSATVSEMHNLFLNCPPGDSAVYTERSAIDSGRGCRIGCHNLEHPGQALSCLAGLAVFSNELDTAWARNAKQSALV